MNLCLQRYPTIRINRPRFARRRDYVFERIVINQFYQSYVDPKPNSRRGYVSLDSFIDQLIEKEESYAEELAQLSSTSPVLDVKVLVLSLFRSCTASAMGAPGQEPGTGNLRPSGLYIQRLLYNDHSCQEIFRNLCCPCRWLCNCVDNLFMSAGNGLSHNHRANDVLVVMSRGNMKYNQACATENGIGGFGIL
jgi:hypothetical protein